jgi:hypothetical protein
MITYYLYKKTHRTTGIQYLGQTKSPDPYKYKGSGKEWKKHIREYGYDVATEVLLETTDPTQIEAMGRHYSLLWNVVESDQWANQKPETGHGGGLGEEGYKRLSEKLKGHPNWLKNQTPDSIEKIRKAQKELWAMLTPAEKTARMKNSCSSSKSWTDSRRKKISAALTGKVLSEDTKIKMSKPCMFISPLGEEFRYDGLNIGCMALGLNYGSVKNCLMTSGTYKKWIIRYI